MVETNSKRLTPFPRENVLKLLESLFDEARSNGGVEYIYTLVRVTGISYGVRDPLLDLREQLEDNFSGLSDQEIFSTYCSLASTEEPLSLVANLLNCKSGKPYDLSPFGHLYGGMFPDIVKPTPSQLSRELIKLAKETGNTEIAQLIADSYPDDVVGACVSGEPCATSENVNVVLGNCRSFLSSLLQIYFRKRLEYRNQPTLYKLPGFEVIELLVNEEYGLYGFRTHFSNGSSAIFVRNAESTDCMNVMLRVPLNFMVGDLEQLRDEWRVGGKRLYEIGLPGRYNALGEWKPLIYPGKYESLQKDARAMSEGDDVQGVFFYMMCTGHRVIEFVVKTNIDLPTEYGRFGDKLHLWKCSPLDANFSLGENIRIYDSWLELDSVDPEYIKSAIAMIGIAVNRLAFAYGGSAAWCLKYRTVSRSGGMATPSKDDLQLLDSLVKRFPGAEDTIILDYALDWYNRGRTDRNIFTAFLCYYIALESVAIAVADGDAELGIGYLKASKEEQSQKRIECIKLKHEALYDKDPERFAREAYFDCVLSLKEKTRRVAERVFGPNHKYIQALFQKSNGHSLSDIRGKLAHGGFALLDREDEKLVRDRLGEMAQISKEFLMRIIFLLNPSDPLPSWSGRHAISMSAADPRTTMISTTDKIFPTKDWRIRVEWCD